MSEPILQKNKRTGEMRISLDGGQTWKPVEGDLGVASAPKVPGATPPTPEHAEMAATAAAKGRGEAPPSAGQPAGERPKSAIEQAEADLEAEKEAHRATLTTPKTPQSLTEKIGEGLSDFGRMAATGFTSGFAPKMIADLAILGTPGRARATGRGIDSGIMSEDEEKLLAERERMAEDEVVRERSPVAAHGGELFGAGLQAYLGGRALGGAAKMFPGAAHTVSRVANPIMRTLGPVAPLARNVAIGTAAGVPAGVGYGDPGRSVSSRAVEGGAMGALAGGVFGEAVQSVLNPILGGLGRHGVKTFKKMQESTSPGGEQVAAFAEAGGEPQSLLKPGTFKPTPSMEATIERGRSAPSGPATGAEVAYDEVASKVVGDLENARKMTLAANTEVTDDLAARYPRPVSMEPLREHINAAMAKFHTADPTEAAIGAARAKRANIRGATPGDDYASLSPESDIPFSSAPTLRRVAESLLRKDPAAGAMAGGSSAERAVAEATQVGRRRPPPIPSAAVRGGPAAVRSIGGRARGSAAYDELADAGAEAGAVAEAEASSGPRPVAGHQQRYAEYDLRNLIQLRQEIDDMSQFESGRGGRGVAALRALGGKVREMISTLVSPDDYALIEQQSKSLAEMKARARTFGVTGNDALDLTPQSKDWHAVRAALAGDTKAMRDQAQGLGLGRQASKDITEARGTAAYEGLERGSKGTVMDTAASAALAASGSRLALPTTIKGLTLPARRAALMHVNPIMAPAGGLMFSGSQGGRMRQKKDEEERP